MNDNYNLLDEVVVYGKRPSSQLNSLAKHLSTAEIPRVTVPIVVPEANFTNIDKSTNKVQQQDDRKYSKDINPNKYQPLTYKYNSNSKMYEGVNFGQPSQIYNPVDYFKHSGRKIQVSPEISFGNDYIGRKIQQAISDGVIDTSNLGARSIRRINKILNKRQPLYDYTYEQPDGEQEWNDLYNYQLSPNDPDQLLYELLSRDLDHNSYFKRPSQDIVNKYKAYDSTQPIVTEEGNLFIPNVNGWNSPAIFNLTKLVQDMGLNDNQVQELLKGYTDYDQSIKYNYFKDYIEAYNKHKNERLAQKGQKGMKTSSDKQQKQLQRFVIDLGFLSGAKSDQEAIQTGAYLYQQLQETQPEQLKALMEVWTEAENQQQGSGKSALQQTLQANSSTQSIKPNQFIAVNGAPASYGQAYLAKLGSKLLHISELNGKCPDGYEIEKYMAGGCVKCRRGKKLREMFNKKKRFSKGNTITQIKHKDSAGSRESYSDANRTASVNVQGNDSSFTSFRRNPGNTNKITHIESNSKAARKNYYDFKKEFEDQQKIKKHQNGGLVDFLKCGRKTKRYIKGGAPDVTEQNTVNNSKTKRKRLQDGNNWAYRDITARKDTSYQSEVNGIREYDQDAKKRFKELQNKKKQEEALKSVQSDKCGNKVKKHQFGGIATLLKKWLGQNQEEVDPTMQNGYYNSDPYNGAITQTQNGVRKTTRPMGGNESTQYETIYTGQNEVTSSRIDGQPFESEIEKHQFDSLQNVYDPSIKFKSLPRINMDHVKRGAMMAPVSEMRIHRKNPKKPYAQ